MNVAAGARRAVSFPLSPALVRTAWKEYRMLRGFWLGVAALAALEMIVVATLVADPARVEVIFASAWGAAALYAVGATTALFAAEREEQTDRFLQLLPRRPRAMLFGKLAAAVLSAAALCGVLAMLGGQIAGGWPEGVRAGQIAAVGSTAVVQALAWGLLASLLIRQPLFAAVAAIAAASLATQAAMLHVDAAINHYTLEDYFQGVPASLALAAMAAAIGMRAGLRWLNPPRQRRKWIADRSPRDGAAGGDATAVIAATPTTTAIARSSRRGTFVRLVWQSWREGWKAMLAVAPIGAFLMLADALLMRPIYGYSAPTSTLLAIPAMCGALAFRGDQRGRQFRFLAEHAARPRLVWLARHAVWLAPTALFGLAATAVAWRLIIFEGMAEFERLIFERSLVGDRFDRQTSAAALHYINVVRPMFGRAVAMIWSGTLAAYALGQLCSMEIASSVLAGAAALILTAVLTLWCLVATAWQLPGFWFVAPIAVAALAATLVRCRSWIVERRGVRTWLVPAGMLVATVAAIGWAVPDVRLAQVDDSDEIFGPFMQESTEIALARWEREEQEARATAAEYERIASEIAAWQPPPEAETGNDAAIEQFDAAPLGSNAILNRPADAAADQELVDKFLSANQQQLNELTHVSRSPHCRLTFVGNELQVGRGPSHYVFALAGYLLKDAQRLTKANELDLALERLATLNRLGAHMVQYQAASFSFPLVSKKLRDALATWAAAPGQTSERVVRAIDELWAAEDLYPPARDMFVAEHLVMSEVIAGGRPPWVFNGMRRSTDHIAWNIQLALAANMLPWEQSRAMRALRVMTDARIAFADGITLQLLRHSQLNVTKSATAHLGSSVQQALLYRGWHGDRSPVDIPTTFVRRSDATVDHPFQLLEHCETSLLVKLEFRGAWDERQTMTEYLSARAWRHAQLHALALAAYPLDHGKYPPTLRELVPNYMKPGLLIDPFSCELFQYRPEGFALPGPSVNSRGEARLENEWLQNESSDLLPAGTPLLWSVGPGYAVPRENYWPLPRRQPGDPWQPMEDKPNSIEFTRTAGGTPGSSQLILLTLPPVEELSGDANSGTTPAGENSEAEETR